MENNRFYENREEIQRVGRENNVEVSIASRMLAKEKGWTNYQAELAAWDDLCISYMRHPTKTLVDLFRE